MIEQVQTCSIVALNENKKKPHTKRNSWKITKKSKINLRKIKYVCFTTTTNTHHIKNRQQQAKKKKEKIRCINLKHS